MNRTEVVALQGHRGYPLVTVLAPTHRTSPDNKPDRLVVRKLVEDAEQRLAAEFDKRESKDVLARLAELVDEVDWEHTLDGLALFASADHAELHYLPFHVEPRVVIDETFATRDVVAGLARSRRYRVLVLSEKPTRLYDAVRDDLVEHVGDGFPRVHSGPGGQQAATGGPGADPSSIRQTAHNDFFRGVEQALSAILVDDPTPVVVVGVQRFLGYFTALATQAERILLTVEGSHDKTPVTKLAGLVWPKVEESLERRAQERVAELDAAVSSERCASGLAQAWRAAAEGRGAHLIVDEGYRQAGTLSPDGLSVDLADDPEAPGVIDDVVDELVELVMAKGGEVTFVRGGLEVHQRVALVLRY